jgi:hypothetical protein
MRGKLSAEGHATFSLRGGQVVEIHCGNPTEATGSPLVVGALSSEGEP